MAMLRCDQATGVRPITLCAISGMAISVTDATSQHPRDNRTNASGRATS
jgi:hypothetical protein